MRNEIWHSAARRFFIGVKKQSARPTSLAKAHLEAELANVEINCPIEVNHWEMDLEEAVVKASRVIQIDLDPCIASENRSSA
jgi:hypothetical protein